MKIRFSPKKKIQLKDLLSDLEKPIDIKEKVIGQINKGTKMSPMDFSRSFSLSASISASTSATISASPSMAAD